MMALKEELLKINNELNSGKIKEEEAFQKASSVCRISGALVREGHKKEFEKAMETKSFKELIDKFTSEAI